MQTESQIREEGLEPYKTMLVESADDRGTLNYDDYSLSAPNPKLAKCIAYLEQFLEDIPVEGKLRLFREHNDIGWKMVIVGIFIPCK